MPIIIDGKTYRNLTEQVKKNMDDIKELQDKASGEITKDYVDTQDEALQGQITENTADITELKSKTQANTTDISALETSKQNTLSQSQLNATNSGITADKVSKYDEYENTKQGKLTAGNNITISADNVISATGGGGGDVTKAYVDAQDAKLEQSINATNTEVSKKLDKMTGTGTGVQAYVNQNGVDRLLNATSDKTRNLIVRWDDNAQLHANAGTTDDAVVNKKQLEDAIANKLDKATTTSGSYAYCRNGNNDETIPVNSLVGTDAIVRRTSTGTIKANAGVDENDCVNKKQLDDAIAGVGGGGAQLNVANTWTALQTFNAGLTTAGALNISGQGSIDISGTISCDGNLTLAGGDILQGGTGNFSDIITSNSYTIDTSGSSTTATSIQALNLKYKYVSTVYTQTYYFVRKNSNVGATILTNKDVNTTDFGWNNSTNKLELNTRIVSCDQSFYDGLTNKDKNTLYVIVG